MTARRRHFQHVADRSLALTTCTPENSKEKLTFCIWPESVIPSQAFMFTLQQRWYLLRCITGVRTFISHFMLIFMVLNRNFSYEIKSGMNSHGEIVR